MSRVKSISVTDFTASVGDDDAELERRPLGDTDSIHREPPGKRNRLHQHHPALLMRSPMHDRNGRMSQSPAPTRQTVVPTANPAATAFSWAFQGVVKGCEAAIEQLLAGREDILILQQDVIRFIIEDGKEVSKCRKSNFSRIIKIRH